MMDTSMWTVAQKFDYDGQTTYIHGDEAYSSKEKALAARKARGGKESGLVICRFEVDRPPTREYAVTVQVLARSQEEAEQIAQRQFAQQGQA